jgi:Ca2+-binding RTX toxin-like protein
MPTYDLEIFATGLYQSDVPTLEIWSEGILDSSYSISSNGTSITLTISYSGALPSSLEFRFNDSSSESGRQIQIQSVKINDRYVNTGNYLSSDNLEKSESAVVDVTNSGFLFDDNDPDSSVFTPVSFALTSDNDTVREYDGSDYILDGLDGRDSIYLGAGNDKINGGLDLDTLRGGGGDDLLFGAEDDDRLFGEDGNDLLYGGIGDDSLYGNSGNDELHGGAGNDKLSSHDGDDVLTGGEGDDTLIGGNGDDYIFGDAGADQIIAGNDNDTVDGGSGNDLIYAGNGDDIVDGGDGDDVLVANAGNDYIRGQAGDDTLYGGPGSDILLGGEDNDTLYSQSSDLITAVINNVLSSNANVFYSEDTNSFYRFVNTAVDWISARNAAGSETLNGLSGTNGHLVTITSETENNFLDSVIGATNAWTAASDVSVEGTWRWNAGPESGKVFYTGIGVVNGLYENWALLQPLDLLGNQDYALRQADGTWNDVNGTSNYGYVIEWEATSLTDTVDQTMLDGGLDADDLYGSDGIDAFVFDNTATVDTIYDFDAAGRDYLDISGILEGYELATDYISDYVQLTEVSGDTYVAVDTDGADNGSNFTDIAILDDTTGLDLNVLFAGDNLAVA